MENVLKLSQIIRGIAWYLAGGKQVRLQNCK